MLRPFGPSAARAAAGLTNPAAPAGRAVKKPDMRVLHVLAITAAKYGAAYCYPSILTIRQNLARFHGRAMSPRTLVRHTNALHDQFYIRKQKRHRRGKRGELECHSTLYHLTGRARALLARLNRAVESACGRIGASFALYRVTHPAEQANRFTPSSFTGPAHDPPGA